MFEKIETLGDLANTSEDETDICIIPNCAKHCLDIYSECYTDKGLQSLKIMVIKIFIDFLIELLATSPDGAAQVEDLKNCPKDGVCPNKNNANVVALSKQLLMFVMIFVLFKIM